MAIKRTFWRGAGGSFPILVAAVGLAVSASAQSKIGYSTVDIGVFGGGDFFQLYQNNNSRQINYAASGVVGFRFTEDFAEHFGFEENFDYARNNLRADVFQDPQVNVFGIAGRNYNASINLMYYFTKREAKWRPFLTVGPGITWYEGEYSAEQPPGGPQENITLKYGPALVYGGGLKYNRWKRVGLRIDVTDTFTRSPHYGLETFPTGPGSVYLPSGGTEHSLKATLGLTLHLRVHDAAAPPPPPAAPAPAPAPAPKAPAVTINVGSIEGAHDVCPGDTITLGSNATVANGSPTYQWMVNGSPVSGATGTSFSVPTTSSGSESVSLQVSAGGQSKTSDAVTVLVKNYSRPTATVSVSPSTIPAGSTAQISGSANGSECGNPVNLTYSASEGSINGTTFDSTGVSFNQGGPGRLQTKVVHITATATDKTGATGTATADITVTSKPVARRLDDLVFPANSSRVNNCGKRLLLEVLTPILRDDPNAKVILIGHRDASEKVTTLDRSRVLNAAAILSAGVGICPQLELSRIEGEWVGTNQASETKPSFCGTSTDVKEKSGQAITDADSKAQFRRVEIWVVPGGADMPAGVAPKALPAPTVKALGCPK
jgi:hypothetical protein